jgi:hypothetical protein
VPPLISEGNLTAGVTFDILVPGSYFCDVIFTGLPAIPALGEELYSDALDIVPGGTLNSVVALHRLGVRVGWVGSLGTDVFSQFVAQMIAVEGVDERLIRRHNGPLRSVTVALSFPRDRAFISYMDTPPDDIQWTLDALQRVTCRHVHVPGLAASPAALDLIRQCQARGITTSMDCQHRAETLDTPLVREIVSQVDIFMPNATEVQRLTRMPPLEMPPFEAALERLTACVAHLVVKEGANGASAYVRGERFHAPALPITPVDTTGAGDVFNAGYLAAYLQGEPPAECLRWGNFCGGRSTLGIGGLSTAPTLHDLRAWLAGQP